MLFVVKQKLIVWSSAKTYFSDNSWLPTHMVIDPHHNIFILCENWPTSLFIYKIKRQFKVERYLILISIECLIIFILSQCSKFWLIPKTSAKYFLYQLVKNREPSAICLIEWRNTPLVATFIVFLDIILQFQHRIL